MNLGETSLLLSHEDQVPSLRQSQALPEDVLEALSLETQEPPAEEKELMPAPPKSDRKRPGRHLVHKHVRHRIKQPRILTPVRQYHRGSGKVLSARGSMSSRSSYGNGTVPSYLRGSLDSFRVVFDGKESITVEATDMVSAQDLGFQKRKGSGSISRVEIRLV